MSEDKNSKISKAIGKIDDKVLKAKISKAFDMVQKGKAENLAKKLKKTDKQELINKIDEFDKQKLKDLNINVNEIKSMVTEDDFKKLENFIGDGGDEVVKKIKKLLY